VAFTSMTLLLNWSEISTSPAALNPPRAAFAGTATVLVRFTGRAVKFPTASK